MKYPQKPIDSGLEVGVVSDMRLVFAVEFLRAHSMVCAIPDGEDSSGRAKLRLQTPEEAVIRAVVLSELLVNEGEQRGWLEPISFETAEELMVKIKTAQVRADNTAYRLDRESRDK